MFPQVCKQKLRSLEVCRDKVSKGGSAVRLVASVALWTCIKVQGRGRVPKANL